MRMDTSIFRELQRIVRFADVRRLCRLTSNTRLILSARSFVGGALDRHPVKYRRPFGNPKNKATMNRRSIQPTFSASALLSIVVMTLGSLAATACSDNPVGRICDLGTTAPPSSGSVIATPSLDCTSRQCLKVPLTGALPPGGRYPMGTEGLCTAECQSDSDCDRVPESPCVNGFTCGVPIVVGPFCCEKFCICKDYIVLPASQELPTPPQCDPTNAQNSCCNISGRKGNAAYPACQ